MTSNYEAKIARVLLLDFWHWEKNRHKRINESFRSEFEKYSSQLDVLIFFPSYSLWYIRNGFKLNKIVIYRI